MKQSLPPDPQSAPAAGDIPADYQALLEELKKTRALCKELDEIIEHAPDGIYITDGKGRALRINAAFERISGLNRDLLLGRDHDELEREGIYSQSHESNSFMSLKQRRTVSVIHEYPATNRQVLDTCTPVFDEHGNVIMTVSSTRDITELNELRATLEQERESRKEYERRFEVVQEYLNQSGELVASDEAMLKTLVLANRMTKVDSTVLLTGDTGVGKEEIARYIHKNGTRGNGLFVEVNCGAISEHIAESELFGYEKGAFTGALQSGRPGLFEAATGGTLFLDEVGELSVELQVKLLRALQTNTITRVGGTRPIPVDVRIIAATNQDLTKMVREHRFREDLYYRLSVVPIYIPSLRERPNDIIPLINHFLAQINDRYGLKKSLSNSAYRALLQYRWPGNVRELKNIIEQIAVIEDSDLITIDALPLHMHQKLEQYCMDPSASLRERVERYEYLLLQQASEIHPTARAAAAYLSMPVSTFVRKRKEYRKKYALPE